MGTQTRRELTAVAAVFVQHVLFPLQHLPTPCAPHLEQFAVHVNDVVVSGSFMKIVDVLRHQQKTIPQRLLQLCQRQVRRVWRNLRLLKLATTGVVKRLNQRRIAGETFRRRHIFYSVFFPQPVRRAEGLNTGFGGDPRPGQHHHSGFIHRFWHHPVSEKDPLTQAFT